MRRSVSAASAGAAISGRQRNASQRKSAAAPSRLLTAGRMTGRECVRVRTADEQGRIGLGERRLQEGGDLVLGSHDERQPAAQERVVGRLQAG